MSTGTRGPVSASDKLWSVHDLAKFLGVPVATLYQWRTKRYGPVGLRVGKHIRYRPADVERWLATLRHEVA
jgi:predicted DNA-binding transcriptional regulator AlpA